MSTCFTSIYRQNELTTWNQCGQCKLLPLNNSFDHVFDHGSKRTCRTTVFHSHRVPRNSRRIHGWTRGESSATMTWVWSSQKKRKLVVPPQVILFKTLPKITWLKSSAFFSSPKWTTFWSRNGSAFVGQRTWQVTWKAVSRVSKGRLKRAWGLGQAAELVRSWEKAVAYWSKHGLSGGEWDRIWLQLLYNFFWAVTSLWLNDWRSETPQLLVSTNGLL